VDDALLMRIVNDLADRPEQSQPFLDREVLHQAMLVERLALDQLHHEVRNAVFRDAAIQNLGEVRMVQAGDDLTFRLESLQQHGLVDAVPHELHGDTLLVLAVDALCREDLTHPAATDEFGEAVVAHDMPDRDCPQCRFAEASHDHFFERCFEHAVLQAGKLQHAAHPTEEIGIASASLLHIRLPRVRRLLECIEQEREGARSRFVA